MRIDNPFQAPRQSSSAVVVEATPGSRSDRAFVSLATGLFSAAAGATLCSVGYLGVVAILEFACVPPLRSPSNYGQFGMRLIEFGAFGLFYGGTFAVLPYWRFRYWLLLFGAISFFLLSGEVASAFDPAEVTSAAIVIVAAIIVLAALLTSMVLRHFQTGRR